MSPRPEPEILVFRRREADGLPVTDRKLRRALDDGEVIRVAAGSFVRNDQWKAVKPIDRHYVRVIETVDRARGTVVLGCHAAAAVLGIDKLGAWPQCVDVIVPRRSGGRSTGMVRRRTTAVTDIETFAWRGHEVTTAAQTALDLARTSGFTGAVIALDQALWGRRSGGALVTAEELEKLFTAAQPRSGDARARRALDFASPLADSVRESQSRSFLHQLGFPAPTLQQRFDLPSGRVARTDFWFPEFEHAGEFDGVGKYFDPELLNGRTPEEALLEEKDRGDELRRVVNRLSRWRAPELNRPRRLYDVLTADGLPSTRPRPPRGLVLR